MTVTWDDTLLDGADLGQSLNDKLNQLIQAIKRRGANNVVGTDIYCDYYCDGTEDDVEIQAAIDDLMPIANYEKRVVSGRGLEYALAAPIYVPSNLVLRDFQFKLSEDIWAVRPKTTCHNANIRNVSVVSDAQRAGAGAFYFDTDIWNVTLDGVFTENMYYGVYVDPSTPRTEVIRIRDSDFWKTKHEHLYFDGGGAGAILENLAMYCEPGSEANSGIHVKNFNGLYLDTIDIMNSGVGMTINPTTGETVKWIKAMKLCCDSGNSHGLSLTGVGAIQGLRFTDFWASANGNYGVQISDATNLDGVTFINPIIQQNGKSGVFMNSGNKIKFLGGSIGANAKSDTGETAEMQGIYFTGVTDLDVSDVRIVNTLHGATGYQAYGIYHLSGGGNVQIHDNNLLGNVTGGLYSGDFTVLTLYRNKGFATENGGTATVANTTTSIAVAHGCDYTPAEEDIDVHPIETLNNASFWWVDTITSTQFTINVNADPGQDVDFKWSVRRI